MTGKSIDAAVQSDDVRAANLARVQSSSATASGQAAAIARGEAPEPPEEHGSTLAIAGGAPEPDAAGPQELRGAQAQPAAFVSNGSIPANVTASPSGFVPMAAVTNDPEEAVRIAQGHLDKPARVSSLGAEPKWLSRADIEQHSANELRAVAYDRGYDLGVERGNRGTREAFLHAQREHKTDWDNGEYDDPEGEQEQEATPEPGATE